jgi:hypothetical protein
MKKMEKGPKIFLIIMASLVGLFLLGRISSLQNRDKTVPQSIPQEQKQEEKTKEIALPQQEKEFIGVIDSTSKEPKTFNDFEISAIEAKRQRLLKQIVGESCSINGWVGTLYQISLSSLKVKFRGQTTEIYLCSTEIPQNNDLSKMEEGQEVVFNGSFIPSGPEALEKCFFITESERMVFKALGVGGSAEDLNRTEILQVVPKFMFKFDSIKPYNTNPTSAPSSPEMPSAASEALQHERAEDTGTFTTSPSLSGYISIYNKKFGCQIDCPREFVSETSPKHLADKDIDEMFFASPDRKAILILQIANNKGGTLMDFYNAVKESVKTSHGEMVYEIAKDNWFVMSWRNAENIFYTKEFVGRGSLNSFIFSYPIQERSKYDNIVANLEKTFRHGDIDRAW